MDIFNNKTILVTGSAGFIGFHVAKALLARGAKVVGVDNFNDYYTPDLKESRNGLLEQFPKYTLVRGNLADQNLITNLFAQQKIDMVCHLAAQAGVRYSLQNPATYIQANIVAFVNLLEAVRHQGIKDFVYASSSSVYGNNTKVPFAVTDETNEPISLYAATKKSNELMAYTYHHLFGINTTGLRFFTVYGPYGRPDMAPMLFAKAITSGQPIKVFNHGHMQRDFTYIDDIVTGILRALETNQGNRVLNLGNNKPVQLEYFITCLEKSLDRTAIKEYEAMQPGDVAITFADIDATTKALNWQPETSIEEGVERFVAWYQEYYKIAVGVEN